jgi:hypothetical protein
VTAWSDGGGATQAPGGGRGYRHGHEIRCRSAYMHMKKKGKNRKMKCGFVLMIKEHTFIQVGADSSGAAGVGCGWTPNQGAAGSRCSRASSQLAAGRKGGPAAAESSNGTGGGCVAKNSGTMGLRPFGNPVAGLLLWVRDGKCCVWPARDP